MIIFAGCFFFMTILLTTAYLPSVSYMAKAMMAERLVIEAWETYPKRTSRNQSLIAGPNGLQMLSIPVNRVNGSHTKTRDIRISDHQPWQKIHWRSLETAYSNSPFFLYYSDLLRPFYEKRSEWLLDFNTSMLDVLLRAFHRQVDISPSASYEKNTSVMTDFREQTGGKAVENTSPVPVYRQVFSERHGFIPGPGIADILFNLGPETPDYLLSIPAAASVSPGPDQ
jgi:hypothetical protein